MNNPLEELERLFNAFINLKDPDKFYSGVASYFRYIEDTYPLNGIAHTIFSSHLNRSVAIYNVSSLYQTIVFHKSGLNSSIDPMSVSESGVFSFHRYMVEAAKQAGLTNKKTIVLHLKEARVCLLGEEPLCYSIKLMKGELSEMFQIIIRLLKTETGKSAGEIAGYFGKVREDRTTQDNTKKTIIKINKRFQAELGVKEELIVHTKSRGKNVYFLNRERFNFKTEK